MRVLTNRDVKPSGRVLRLCPAFCLREARWWLQLEVRKTSKLLTHKAVNNTAPEYLCDLIFRVKSTTIHTHTSFDPCLLCIPRISKTCANSFFDRSFVYAAPTLWNALDLDIRLLPFDTFKKRVQDSSLSVIN